MNQITNQIQERLNEISLSQPLIHWLMDEVNYQMATWNEKTTSTAGIHDQYDFITFIKSYNDEIVHIVSRNPEPQASTRAMHNIRKIAAMVLSCLAQSDNLDKLYKLYEPEQSISLELNPAKASNLISYSLNKAFRAEILDLSVYNELLNIFYTCIEIGNTFNTRPLRGEIEEKLKGCIS